MELIIIKKMRKMNMKNLYVLCIIIVACLFAACSSSDDGNLANGKSSLSLNVAPGVTTRVAETEDTTKVVKTTWESTDKLDVWHKFTKSGSATLTNLEFSNTSTPGTTGTSTFKYTTAYTGAEYYYTNGNNVLVFNKLGTNATRTASNDSVVVLALTNYGSQTGTLASMKSFDAMCGSAAVSNGKPADITMNHLCSVICFKLSGLAASTTYSVTFGCSAADKSILPSTASFTLNTRGTVTAKTLTGATSWTVSSATSDASGSALVYLMTFPFSNISGYLTIKATGGSKVYYKAITLNNFSLASGTAKKQTCKLATSNTGMPITTGNRGGNYVWNSDFYWHHFSSKANCPSYDEYKQIWANGWIWDPGTSAAADPAINAVTGGVSGLWLSTYCKIPNITVPSAYTETSQPLAALSTWKAADTTTNTGTWLVTHCFFLPYNTPSRTNSSGATKAPIAMGQYFFVNNNEVRSDNYAYMPRMFFSSSTVTGGTWGFQPALESVVVPYFTISR
jgi:hypothetical protein